MNHILRYLRFELHRAQRLEAGTGVWAPAGDDATFWLFCVLQGRWGWVDASGGYRELSDGDVLLMPGGCRGPLHPGGSRPAFGRSMTGHPRQRLGPGHDCEGIAFAGELTLAGQQRHPLLSGLSSCIAVSSTAITADLVRRHPAYVIDEILGEDDEADPALIAPLVQVLAAVAFAAHLRSAGRHHHFVRALLDPEIGRAIAAIHTSPGNNWSLERLASTAGLPRSTFSQRFTALAGVPVMKYLTTWRMSLALEQLKSGNTDLEDVSRKIGYRSPVAFQKAFKRVHGMTPTQATSV